MIFWLVRCKTCGSVFQDHCCSGKSDRAEASVTYTQLSLFKEERDEE